MTNERKLNDANNFYCHLLRKINSCYDEKNVVDCSKNNYYGSEKCEECGEECKCKINNNKAYESGKCKKEVNNSEGCLSKETDEEICDGKKIKRYLDYLIPEWENITPTRLYKHIQKMHENAESIRQFEIGLIWRRALYFIPLIVIFFTAFGGAFFSFQSEFGVINSNKFVTINQDRNVKFMGHIASDYGARDKIDDGVFTDSNENETGHYILLAIALINACLCFFLTKMNIESQRWQNNWECHIDYLQQILGFKLMQTCLRPRGRYFSIRRTNIFIGFLAFLAWYFIIVLLFALLLNINVDFQSAYNSIYQFSYYEFSCRNFSFCTYNYFLTVVLILTLIMTPIFINNIYYCLTGEGFFKKSKKVSISINNKFYIRELEIFAEKDFSERQSLNFEDKNKMYIHAFVITFIIIITYFLVYLFSSYSSYSSIIIVTIIPFLIFIIPVIIPVIISIGLTFFISFIIPVIFVIIFSIPLILTFISYAIDLPSILIICFPIFIAIISGILCFIIESVYKIEKAFNRSRLSYPLKA